MARQPVGVSPKQSPSLSRNGFQAMLSRPRQGIFRLALQCRLGNVGVCTLDAANAHGNADAQFGGSFQALVRQPTPVSKALYTAPWERARRPTWHT